MHNLPLFALGLCGSFGFPSRAVVARRTLSAVHLSCRLQCPALKSNGSTHSGNMRATQRAVLCNQLPGIQASRPILRLALVQGNGMVATDKQVCCIFATLRLLGRRTPHAGRATLGALSELNYAEKGGSVTDQSATPGSYAVASVTQTQTSSITNPTKLQPSGGGLHSRRLLTVTPGGASSAQSQQAGNTSVFIRAFPSVGNRWGSVSSWPGCACPPGVPALKQVHRIRGHTRVDASYLYATGRWSPISPHVSSCGGESNRDGASVMASPQRPVCCCVTDNGFHLTRPQMTVSDSANCALHSTNRTVDFRGCWHG